MLWRRTAHDRAGSALDRARRPVVVLASALVAAGVVGGAVLVGLPEGAGPDGTSADIGLSAAARAGGSPTTARQTASGSTAPGTTPAAAAPTSSAVSSRATSSGATTSRATSSSVTAATSLPASPPVPSVVTPAGSSPAPAPATAQIPAAVQPPTTGSAGSAVGNQAALSWAPPAGSAGYPVRSVTTADALTVVDGRGGDIRIELSPSHAVGPVTIQNCRNAVLIGGRITVLPTSQVGGYDQRAIYVKNCTGTVHIEGVQIDGNVEGSEADAIAVNSPRAVVQIENVRADGMRGGYSSNHADIFQPWGGVAEYRIDRLTGTSNYQGLTTSEVSGQIGRGTIRSTNIAGSDAGVLDQGGYLFWLKCNDGYPLELDDVYVAGRSGRPLSRSVWPMPSDSGCPSTIVDGTATWPTVTTVTGGVHEGYPATGDYVPAGSVGLGYVSPGYR